MNTPTSEQIETYQVCFALNNLGVRLLENGHFRDACQTFKAALLAIKPHFLSKQQNDSTSTSNGKAFLNAEFAKASARATKPMSKHSVLVDVSAIDEGDEEAWETAQQYGPTGSIVFPIRFRDLPSLASLLQEGLDFHIAVLVYNFGLTQLLVHRFTKHKGTNRILKDAHQLLSLADSIVYRNLSENDSSSRLFAFFSLDFLVLGNLLMVFRLQQQTDKVDHVNETLVELHKLQQQWQMETIPWASRDMLVAAAA